MKSNESVLIIHYLGKYRSNLEFVVAYG